METPILPKETKRQKFWARQYSSTITRAQVIFDVIFGAIIPVVLLIFDPFVFQGTGCVGPAFFSYSLFAYLAIGSGIGTLLVWLLVPPLRHQIGVLLGGILVIGAVFAGLLGLMLLPFSLLGILAYGLGLLGLIPFLTAFVYYRNGRRALQAAKLNGGNRLALILSPLIGAVLVLGIPMLVQTQIIKSIDMAMAQIAQNPATPDTMAVGQLQQINSLCLGLCTSSLYAAFERVEHAHPAQRQDLTRLYQDITQQVVYSFSCDTSD